jgi:hypothetical protein
MPLPDIFSKEKQEQLVPTKKRPTAPGYGKYDPDLYPKIAYQVLSSNYLKCLTDVAVALDCSTEALIQWRKKFPDFNKMVKKGLAVGEAKFREKLRKHSFKPQGNVNNGLIKMLARNVYGISEEEPRIIINNTIEQNPEKALKERGIPVPDIPIEDLNEESCGACEICDKENCPGGV